MTHTFRYFVELKNGYKPVMQTEVERTIIINIEACNRVTADRMIKALLVGTNNIESIDGICLD